MYIEQFLTHLEVQRDASPETIKAYRSDLVLFTDFLRARKVAIDNVRPGHIDLYSAALKQRPGRAENGRQTAASIRRRLAAVSSLYEYLKIRTNGKVINPVSRLHRPKRPKRKPNPMPESVVEQLERIPHFRDRALFLLFNTSGLRLSELHQLNRDSLTLQNDRVNGDEIVLAAGRVVGKGGKPRGFYITLETLEAVADYLDQRGDDSIPALFISSHRKRLSKRSIQSILERWCERLGLPRQHVHQFRHTAATNLGNAGMPLMELQKLLGHESPDTTMQYCKTKPQRVLQEYFAAMAIMNDSEQQKE